MPARPAQPALAATRDRAAARTSEQWLAELREDAPGRDAAIADLHALLLRAARFELARRRAALGGFSDADVEDLAVHAADDAALAVLAKLDEYRHASRFTTWAYKFALLEAAVKARRLPWRDAVVSLQPAAWENVPDAAPSPSLAAETRELLESVRRGMAETLSPHQRGVLLAVAVEGVPIDVLAERLDSTRGALYKTIHDARQKLRRYLAALGHEVTVP